MFNPKPNPNTNQKNKSIHNPTQPEIFQPETQPEPNFGLTFRPKPSPKPGWVRVGFRVGLKMETLLP